jgi:hypothetical protein
VQSSPGSRHPAGFTPTGFPAPPAPAQRVRRIAGAVLTAVLAISAAVVLTKPDEPRAAAAGTVFPGITKRADDPVTRVLRAQAAALLRGDRPGWLAAVDPAKPALRKRYQGLYASLRALRISHFEYHFEPGTPTSGAVVTTDVEVAFCFSQDPCPAYVRSRRQGPPRIAQTLTLRATGPGYVITGLAAAEQPTHLQPTPWEAGDLVVAEGKRVSVGAPPELAGRLPEVVQVADLAAAVNDRYAPLMGNPQRRYRLYLASAKTWKIWYGAGLAEWAAGYMQPLNDAGADAVIDLSGISDRDELREVVQHEFGHVVTVGGRDPADQWLAEGIAEYIGHQPRPAPDTASSVFLRRMPRPASMVPRPLLDGDGTERAGEFYAHSHFAVECMAVKYGESAMLTFVRLRLREDRSRDDAARSAFGRRFAAVDKACTAWLRQQI